MYNDMERNLIFLLTLEVKVMDMAFFSEPTPEDAAKMLQTIQQQLAEVEQIRLRMQYDQTQIEASGARIDERLMQIQVQLNQIQQTR